MLCSNCKLQMMNHAFHGLQSVARNGRKKKRKNVEKMLTAAENQVKDVEKMLQQQGR